MSRGKPREFQQHLGVTCPTARPRYTELLGRLGLHEHEPARPIDCDPSLVMRDLASGAITVDEAEIILKDGRTP